MKKYLWLRKSLFCATILTSTFASASEKTEIYNDNVVQINQIVQEDYEDRYLEYRQKAIEYAETLPAPQLSESFFGTVEDTTGWTGAISNYKSLMHINLLPSEETWPVRGFVKKYNLHLIQVTESHIEQQKYNFFDILTQQQ